MLWTRFHPLEPGAGCDGEGCNGVCERDQRAAVPHDFAEGAVVGVAAEHGGVVEHQLPCNASNTRGEFRVDGVQHTTHSTQSFAIANTEETQDYGA